jgi:crotonobetainyl-CoA:carnitine CoA-transferase CaiB-like acyl-CoA transferase
MVAVISHSDWINFCKALGLSGEFRDQFIDPRIRVQHQNDIYALVEPIFLKAPSREWVDILEDHDILCGMIYEYDTLFDDPQVKSLEIIDQASDPATVKSPIRFIRGATWSTSSGAPELGAHTGTVFNSCQEAKPTNHGINKLIHEENP